MSGPETQRPREAPVRPHARPAKPHGVWRRWQPGHRHLSTQGTSQEPWGAPLKRSPIALALHPGWGALPSPQGSGLHHLLWTSPSPFLPQIPRVASQPQTEKAQDPERQPWGPAPCRDAGIGQRAAGAPGQCAQIQRLLAGLRRRYSHLLCSQFCSLT